MTITKQTLPTDDKMQVAYAFEIEAKLKEKPFEENPRRHWAEIQRGLLDTLLERLMLEGAIEERLEKTEVLNEWKLYLKIRAMLPSKPDQRPQRPPSP